MTKLNPQERAAEIARVKQLLDDTNAKIQEWHTSGKKGPREGNFSKSYRARILMYAARLRDLKAGHL